MASRFDCDFASNRLFEDKPFLRRFVDPEVAKALMTTTSKLQQLEDEKVFAEEALRQGVTVFDLAARLCAEGCEEDLIAMQRERIRSINIALGTNALHEDAASLGFNRTSL